jgi:NAD(P)-dependent dehydrogenase (short-subunit alcohol dehydrogenase family)
VTLLDRALDSTLLWSFDASGYRRHARRFRREDTEVDLHGANVVVTGANAGIGFAICEALGSLGATVWMVCRDAARGAAARDRLAERCRFPPRLCVADVGELADVRALATALPGHIHALVHNAGSLDAGLRRTRDGHEATFATHVLGPHLLTRLVGSRCGRVVFMSSGGMLAARLDLDALRTPPSPFDGVQAYARAKRAQVELLPCWAARLPGAAVHAMHPGWAATSGVARALPRFDRWMRGRLRTAAEGADTAIWLCVADEPARCTGAFWFDRHVAPTHLVPWTRTPPSAASEAFAALDRLTDASPDADHAGPGELDRGLPA